MRFLWYFLLVPYWLMLIVVFLVFLVSSTIISTLLMIILQKRAQRSLVALYKTWSFLFFFFSLVRIRIYNEDILIKNTPCIIASNHSSNLDMFIGAYTVPLGTRPLAKKQLKKIPLLGYLFSTVCVLVDRSSKESRAKSSLAMIDVLRKGYSVFIYPEGTRNKGKLPLNSFYDGAFRFAIEAGVPVVAQCVINARSITGPDSYWVRPGTISIRYLGPYETKDLKLSDLEELKARVFKDMNETIVREDPVFRGKAEFISG